MIKAVIRYKDGTEEPMDFKTFNEYGRYIDENAAKISQARADYVRPAQIRQGRKGK